MYTPFNLNNSVKVKLNEKGLAMHRAEWDTVFAGITSFTYNAPMVDSEGYSEFHMWEFMHIFGPAMTMGGELPFNMNVLIDIEKLT
jgi:hypothetical protein